MLTLVSLIPSSSLLLSRPSFDFVDPLDLMQNGLDRSAVIEDLPSRRSIDTQSDLKEDEEEEEEEEETLFEAGRSFSSHLLDTFTRFRLPSSKSSAELADSPVPVPVPVPSLTPSTSTSSTGPKEKATLLSICSSLPFPLDLFNEVRLSLSSAVRTLRRVRSLVDL